MTHITTVALVPAVSVHLPGRQALRFAGTWRFEIAKSEQPAGPGHSAEGVL